MQKTYITSRSLTFEGHVQERVCVSLWDRKRWPYDAVKENDVVYFYDARVRKFILKSQVRRVLKFQYAAKQAVRERIIEEYGKDPAETPYFVNASAEGYCFAFNVMKTETLDIQKPDGLLFRHDGWVNCADKAAKPWLRLIEEATVGIKTLDVLSSQLDAEGYFDPTNELDTRSRVLREIAQRRGQSQFRKALLQVHGKKCLVTGFDAEQALEAAHISPYLGTESNHLSNGLLLRADIHTLFDLHFIGIDPTNMRVRLKPALLDGCYSQYENVVIGSSGQQRKLISKAALEARWSDFLSQ